ncbi:hypothetical protein TNCT_163531 [Trichonephila clavata]|uniref:H15 domain-containing protein n=1 Tax=Trichonephila clavata TaxID=2740835 RepID=A0A8X6M5L6_TRICU|nr:hypothetical protein TNCT_163531 [Trichonephila clavata]
MVIAAITTLKERGGSSLVAIKKHIGSQHKVDLDRLTPFIRKYSRAPSFPELSYRPRKRSKRIIQVERIRSKEQ